MYRSKGWFVVSDKSIIELASFSAAVAYADGFICSCRLVKEIDPIKREIRLVDRQGYSAGADLPDLDDRTAHVPPPDSLYDFELIGN